MLKELKYAAISNQTTECSLLCQRPLTEKQTLSCVCSLELNVLGPQGGAAIAEGLKGNSTLTSLK